MGLIKVDSRRAYELYIKKTVAKMSASNKQKAIIRKIAMQCFDDGISHNRNDLKVEV